MRTHPRAHCPATGAHTQTLTSEWGRAPLTVDAVIPTVMIRHKLGQTHIGTSDRDVLRTIRAGIITSPMRHRFTREIRKQTYAATLWQHHENQAEYTRIMSGTF